MRSSWDETKANSAYHFRRDVHDPRWDQPIGLGHIIPMWTKDVYSIIDQSKQATWATRGYKGEGVEVPPADLAAEEYDLTRSGADKDLVVSNLSWQLPPSLEKLQELFALQDCMARIHVQLPGQVWTRHIDKLQKWCPDDPSQVMRVMIQLTDWEPGQFWEYGNHSYRSWRAGDVTTFDWANVPHCTANAGHDPRVTLQLTGVITNETKEFLKALRSVNKYKV